MRNKILRANLRKERTRRIINQHCIIPSSEFVNEKRYRLSIHKTSKHIYAQLIDLNQNGKIMCSASTLEYRNKNYNKSYCNKENATKVGHDIAKKILEQGITRISIDRGSNKYVGKIEALVNAMRAECGNKAAF